MKLEVFFLEVIFVLKVMSDIMFATQLLLQHDIKH